ncbi:MAG: Gfo/Idh/MocA family protein [Pseudobdellovibrionaceae bacterium]
MDKKKVRYAVVGLGDIAQEAVLPGFKHAKSNSELTALVSGDPKKLKTLGKKFGVTNLYSYEGYQDLLKSGQIDAVYIATPNNLHKSYAVEAAQSGINILVEKPMALSEQGCLTMMRAANENNVKLMVAYRLHFDPANLEAVKIAKSGKLGELKIFNSIFTYQLTDTKNIRLKFQMGGGPLYDIGIYCINASRYLFQDEPVEVFAEALSSKDPRFNEVEEMASVILRFPKTRLASFTVSFASEASASYDLLGTSGKIRLEKAYEYTEDMKLITTIKEKDTVKVFKEHDQFGPEIEYFSDCILKNIEPEPSAEEGLLDIKILEAIHESIRIGRPVKIDYFKKTTRPSTSQQFVKPPFPKQPTVHARGPHE